MITEGIIETVDFGSTVCTVRIPLFETVQSTSPFTLPARIAIQPGVCNSYMAGDLVWLAFEQDRAHRPVIIGKIFQSVDQTLTKSRGIYQVETLRCTNNAEIPADTALISGIPGYNTIQKIASKVQFLDKATSGEVPAEILASRYLTTLEILDSNSTSLILLLETQRPYVKEDLNSLLQRLNLSCNSVDKFFPVRAINNTSIGCFVTKNDITSDYIFHLIGANGQELTGNYSISTIKSVEITQI